MKKDLLHELFERDESSNREKLLPLYVSFKSIYSMSDCTKLPMVT